MFNSEQRRQNRELLKIKREKDNLVYSDLSNVILFRGSLAEYEKWRGYECEVLGPSYQPPCDVFNLRDEDFNMHKEGIEAIVNAQGYFWTTDKIGIHQSRPVGLPVRKKR